MRNSRVFAEGRLMYVTKTSFIQSEVARRQRVDDAQIGQPYLVNARLKSTLQADGILPRLRISFRYCH